MYKRDGFPEEGEFIIVTVERILPHSVFVNLDEYATKIAGMIHTSEMDRRLVRNLRTYIKVGRKLVCKVMDVDKSKKHVDLSLRRVGSGQKRTKEASWKNEKKAYDLLIMFGKINKIKIDVLQEKVIMNILKKYDSVYPVFLDVAAGDDKILNSAGVDKSIASKLQKFIQTRIAPPKANIKGNLMLASAESDGLEQIKKVVKQAVGFAKKNNMDLQIKYIGAPKYLLTLQASDPKEASQFLEKTLNAMKTELVKHKGCLEFKQH